MERIAWAAFHAPLVARELDVWREWRDGEPGACSIMSRELDPIVALLERRAALGAPALGREVAVQIARLF